MKYEYDIKEVYDNLSERYHRITKNHFFNAYLEIPATMSMLKDVKNKKVLDLGCGTGRHTAILKKRGAMVWGIDLSPKMLDIAKSEIKGVDFQVGSVYKLPYRSSFFDIVVAGLVIDYFRDLDRALKEIYRVLKNDGVFVFSLTNPIMEMSQRIKGRPRTYRKFKNYFKEGKTRAYWPTFKVTIPYYHRTFQTLIRAIIKNRFSIEDFVDARPVKKAKNLDPSRYSTFSKIPHFIIFKVRKVKI